MKNSTKLLAIIFLSSFANSCNYIANKIAKPKYQIVSRAIIGQARLSYGANCFLDYKVTDSTEEYILRTKVESNIVLNIHYTIVYPMKTTSNNTITTAKYEIRHKKHLLGSFLEYEPEKTKNDTLDLPIYTEPENFGPTREIAIKRYREYLLNQKQSVLR